MIPDSEHVSVTFFGSTFKVLCSAQFDIDKHER